MIEFIDVNCAIVEDLHNCIKKDEDGKKTAQTDDQQIYHRRVFLGTLMRRLENK